MTFERVRPSASSLPPFLVSDQPDKARGLEEAVSWDLSSVSDQKYKILLTKLAYDVYVEMPFHQVKAVRTPALEW